MVRHAGHRFEWACPEFRERALGVAGRFGYEVRFLRVGPHRPEYRSPTQMRVFTRS
jgi:hypothetical protein